MRSGCAPYHIRRSVACTSSSTRRRSRLCRRRSRPPGTRKRTRLIARLIMHSWPRRDSAAGVSQPCVGLRSRWSVVAERHHRLRLTRAPRWKPPRPARPTAYAPSTPIVAPMTTITAVRLAAIATFLSRSDRKALPEHVRRRWSASSSPAGRDRYDVELARG